MNNTKQIRFNKYYDKFQDNSKKSNFFQKLLFIVLFAHLIVSFLTPKVNIDNNSNVVSRTAVNTKKLSCFDVYGKKADETYYSEYKRFLIKNDEICNNYISNLRYFADSLAAEKCTYTNCTKLIGYLAKDKVTGSCCGSEYLSELLEFSINYKMKSFVKAMNSNMLNYQSKMQQITQEYAYNICVNMPVASKLYFDKKQKYDTPDFKIALANLGMDGALNAIAITFEIRTLVSTGFLRGLRKYIVQLAWSVFKTPIKKAATSVAVSLADGPLPIGDVIGAIGLAWTAYDISQMRSDFEKQVSDSIYNKLYNEISHIRQQSSESLYDIYNNFHQIRLKMEIGFKKEYSQIQ